MSDSKEKSQDQGATSETAQKEENKEMNKKQQEKWFQLLKLEDTLQLLMSWMSGLLEIIRQIREVEDSRKAEEMELLRHHMYGPCGDVDSLYSLEKYWSSIFEVLKQINND